MAHIGVAVETDTVACPDVPLAITHIQAVLTWMQTSRFRGGLGYSVNRVQTTHAYKALVALGGSWPT